MLHRLGAAMGTNTLFFSKDAFLVAIPFLLLIVFAVFGLNDRLGHAGTKEKPRRRLCGVDGAGEPIMRDPDGKLSRRSRKGSNVPSRTADRSPMNSFSGSGEAQSQ